MNEANKILNTVVTFQTFLSTVQKPLGSMWTWNFLPE